jgi:hypothetical protein
VKIYPITIPGGSDTEMQYNNGGIFGGASGATYNDGTNISTFTGATITNCAVLGSDSAVFQPNADSTTFFQILDADGGSPVLNIDTDNEYVSIGHNAPAATFDVLGDFMFLGGSNRTDSTNKTGRIAGVHWDTDEEPVTFMLYNSTETVSSVNFGGGSALMNAATQVDFYTAADNTTTTGTKRLVIQGDGDVGINTNAPRVYNGGLDISCGGMSLVLGADNSAITRTDSTNKFVRIGMPIWDNDDNPNLSGILYAYTTSSANILNFGGGTSAFNAATEVGFYTAANQSTTTGTKRMKIDASGITYIGDGGTTNYAKIAVDGEINLVGTARVTKHFNIPLEEARGANAPTQHITEAPFLGWEFEVNDDTHHSIPIPHDMDFTQPMNIYVEWYTDEDQTDDEVNWQVSWNAKAAGEAMNAGATTDTSGDVNCSAQWLLVNTLVETIPGNSIAADDVVGIDMTRVAIVDGTNPAATSIIVVAIHAEYTSNKLGEAT